MNSTQKILIGISVFFCVMFLLLIYSFYPVINYDARYSQHVNQGFSDSLAPGRQLIYDRNGKIITDRMYKNGYYTFVKTDINAQFVKDLVYIEDKNYYKHFGVNILSKFRAIKDNFSGERVSGASTITEQYVKNKYFKESGRTILQKIREALLAIYFTSTRTKDHILNIYYHDAYFGNQLYGVGAAIEVYFGKDDLEDLTEEEITILLSLLHNPGIKSLEEKYFREYFEKIKDRLGYSFERTYFGKLNTKENIDMLPFVSQLYNENGNYNKYKDGIQATIDSELQEYTREIILDQLLKLQGKNVTNAAVFAFIPQTREILIYQGSKDFYSKHIDGQVNVIRAKRQPGSTVKPFLYLHALENGMSPDDLIIDVESEYNSFQKGKSYITENYSLKEYGLIRLKKALGNSMNNATVRLASELGLEEVYDYYKQFGFQFDYGPEYYGYSLVLGNAEVTLENLVKNYAKLLGESSEKFLLYDILSDSDNRDISFGVNSTLNTSIPQAVKTGTSSEFRDNWVISYHPDLVVGVWVGNNNNSSMIGVTGITGAGEIWHKVIEKAIALGYLKEDKTIIPSGIMEQEYCLDTNCFQKEYIYSSGEKKYYSRIGEYYFSRRDISEKLSDFEEEKLSKLGIIIGE